MSEKNVPGQFGVSRGSAGRDRRRMAAVEVLAHRWPGQGASRVLRVLDQLRRGPILKIEAGRGGVIPAANLSACRAAVALEDHQVQTKIVVVADLGICLVCAAASCRRRDGAIQSADSGLAERTVVPLQEGKRVGAEFGARDAHRLAAAGEIGVSDVEVVVATRALVDEAAGDGVAQIRVWNGRLGFWALKNRMTAGSAQRAAFRCGPGFPIVR